MSGDLMPPVVTEFRADTAHFEAGLKQAGKSVEGMASKIKSHSSEMSGHLQSVGDSMLTGFAGPLGMASAGLAGIGAALLKAGSDATDFGVSVGRLQRLTGGTSQEMSGLAYAATATGVDIDSLGRALTIASKGAESGKFEKLGISVKDASGHMKPMEQILGTVANKFQTLGEGMERTTLARDLFGRAGTALIPMLKDGSAALAQQTEEARKYGLILDDTAIKKAREAKAAQREMAAAMKGAWEEIGQIVQPIQTTIARDTAEVFAGMRTIFTQYQDQANMIGENTTKLIDAKGWDEGAAQIQRVQAQIDDLHRSVSETNRLTSPIDEQSYNHLIDSLEKTKTASNEYRTAVKALSDEQGISFEAAQKLYEAQHRTAASAEEVAKATAEESKALQDAKKDVDDATKAFDAYWKKATGNLDHQAEFEQAMRDSAKSVKDHGTGFNYLTGQIDLTSEAGNQNRIVFEKQRDAILAWTKEIGDTKGPDAAKDAFVGLEHIMAKNLLPQFGYNKTAVDDLMTSLHLTAQDWNINVLLSGTEDAEAKLHALQMQLIQAHPMGFSPPPGTPGTGVHKMAAGGIVPATPGGVMANIAEGGKAEAVIPLDQLPHLIAQGLHAAGMGGGQSMSGPIVLEIDGHQLTGFLRTSEMRIT